MESLYRELSSGPAESRLVRTLFYASDGATFGGICYFAVSLVVFTLSGVEPWLVALVVVFLALGVGKAGAFALATSNASRSPIHEEWTSVRRWHWVGVVVGAVTGLLVAVTVLLWGWQLESALSEVKLLGFAVVVFGFLVRAGVERVASREIDADSTTDAGGT